MKVISPRGEKNYNMTKLKIYLVSLESNTGTDRVIEDLNSRLMTLKFDSEIIQPKKLLEKYLRGILSTYRSKIPGGRYLSNLAVEIFLLKELIKNRDNSIIVVTFIYPLWSPLLKLLQLSGRIKYFYFLPDMMWKKKYVKNIRWAIHGFLSNFGVKNSNLILVPTASAFLDCLTFLNVRNHKKIKYLSTPINSEYWDDILSIGSKKLQAKKFIFHPAGTKPSKNSSKAIDAFKQMKVDDLYFVCLKNETNSEKGDPRIYDSSVIYLANITDQEMKWLYENCLFVSVVSVEEGVGLPVLEAQHFRKLVVTSFISALPEVAGVKEIFTNPFDEDAIRRAYLLAYKQATLREELTQDLKDEINYYGNECLLEIKGIFELKL